MKHSNIALFVPHLGCRHKCSFCDQRTITGEQYLPHKEDVDKAVNTALKCAGRDKLENTEIAFFGGSFTGIPYEYMKELLDSAFYYVKNNIVSGIRLSTRPDYINDEILELLKEKGVTSIELGAQSMNNEVLRANMRGHSVEDVEKSSKLIKDYGFSLGLQMMTGLYKSDRQTDFETAKKIAQLKPDTVRIYPTAVIDGTYLGKLFKEGKYSPPDTYDSVEICANLLDFFVCRDIEVIRLGLHDSASLKEGFLGGAYHPSFKELCVSYLFYCSFLKATEGLNIYGKQLIVHANKRDASAFIGQKKENIKKLGEKNIHIKIIGDEKIKQGFAEIYLCDDEKGRSIGAFKIFGNTRL